MDIIKKETITETRVITIVIDCKCDKCGRTIGSAGSHCEREFSLQFKSGKAWPDGSGDWAGWEVEDLCDDCVLALYHLVKANGFTVKRIQESW